MNYQLQSCPENTLTINSTLPAAPPKIASQESSRSKTSPLSGVETLPFNPQTLHLLKFRGKRT